MRVRLVQWFFRGAVLVAYGSACAVCDVGPAALLNASHIIPWADDPKRRADPRNGLCLCALHDRAFDRGLMTFDVDLRLRLSAQLRDRAGSGVHAHAFVLQEGRPLRLPDRFAPDAAALAYHRTVLFQG